MKEQTANAILQWKKAVMEREFSRMNGRQKEAVFHTDGPLLILAGAGSGKTTVLVNRIANLIRWGGAYHSTALPPELSQEDLDLLQAAAEEGRALPDAIRERLAVEPCRPWQILAITFTNKAAGEMKERINDMCGYEGEGVWVSTFHSMCVRILKTDIHNIGYDKNFSIYDEDDSLRVITEILKEKNIEDFKPKAFKGAISSAKNKMTPYEYIPGI